MKLLSFKHTLKIYGVVLSDNLKRNKQINFINKFCHNNKHRHKHGHKDTPNS